MCVCFVYPTHARSCADLIATTPLPHSPTPPLLHSPTHPLLYRPPLAPTSDPVGVPLMIFCLLFPLRKRLNPEADTEAAQLETTTNDKVLAHSIVTSVFRKYRPKW